jgi:hypothetical protein
VATVEERVVEAGVVEAGVVDFVDGAGRELMVAVGCDTAVDSATAVDTATPVGSDMAVGGAVVVGGLSAVAALEVELPVEPEVDPATGPLTLPEQPTNGRMAARIRMRRRASEVIVFLTISQQVRREKVSRRLPGHATRKPERLFQQDRELANVIICALILTIRIRMTTNRYFSRVC